MKSIMHDKADGTCYLCIRLNNDYNRRAGLEEHHVIYGMGNRRLSEKYGLKVYLCHAHHNDESSGAAVHFNKAVRQQLCENAQRAFMKKYPDLDFKEIFGTNYLSESGD